MNTNNNIDPVDEALRLIYLDTAKDADTGASSSKLNEILEGEYSIKISSEKRDILLANIAKTASILSFGELLNNTMVTNNKEGQFIAEEVKLPLSVVEQLKADAVYTNNIPVMLLMKLLQYLNIPFQQAEKAILKTFDLINSQGMIEKMSFHGNQLSYRKGYHSSRESITWAGKDMVGKDLFENKEALNKYLSRLKELMNK